MKSKDIERIGSPLPIDESIGMQNKARLVQQAGIMCIFILILLAALGLFGQGILSNKKSEADGNAVTYERFGRFGGETKLVFNLATSNDSITQISIPSAYLEYFKIECIAPEPNKNSTVNNEIIYTFNGTTPKHITFFLSPEKRGSIKATIKGNRTNFNVSHFIYP